MSPAQLFLVAPGPGDLLTVAHNALSIRSRAAHRTAAATGPAPRGTLAATPTTDTTAAAAIAPPAPNRASCAATAAGCACSTAAIAAGVGTAGRGNGDVDGVRTVGLVEALRRYRGRRRGDREAGGARAVGKLLCVANDEGGPPATLGCLLADLDDVLLHPHQDLLHH